MGGCRSNELYKLNIDDVEDLQTHLLITIPKTKAKNPRTFTINSTFYNIVKRYMDLRPSHVKISAFFLNYQKSRCTIQRIGKNKFVEIGKQIATYLNLPNPQSYTGHCYRGLSVHPYVNGGGGVTGVKRPGGWRSTQVPEDRPTKRTVTTAETIVKQINSNQAYSFTAIEIPNLCIENFSKVINTSRPIHFINCTITNFNVIRK